LFKAIFNLINVWHKSTYNKKVININSNNSTIIIKDRRVSIKSLKFKGRQEGGKGIILNIRRLLKAI
jgi:hypothetical protein